MPEALFRSIPVEYGGLYPSGRDRERDRAAGCGRARDKTVRQTDEKAGHTMSHVARACVQPPFKVTVPIVPRLNLTLDQATELPLDRRSHYGTRLLWTERSDPIAEEIETPEADQQRVLSSP